MITLLFGDIKEIKLHAATNKTFKTQIYDNFHKNRDTLYCKKQYITQATTILHWTLQTILQRTIYED